MDKITSKMQNSAENIVNLNTRLSSRRTTKRKFFYEYVKDCKKMKKAPFEDEDYARCIGHISATGSHHYSSESDDSSDEESFIREAQTDSKAIACEDASTPMDTYAVSDHYREGISHSNAQEAIAWEDESTPMDTYAASDHDREGIFHSKAQTVSKASSSNEEEQPISMEPDIPTDPYKVTDPKELERRARIEKDFDEFLEGLQSVRRRIRCRAIEYATSQQRIHNLRKLEP